ncbi:MAG: sigma-70 family RNA polymerase sigma factor [Bacteroidetes bacterium]|nr:sigma-70 family RNA polymerase sigma factor [Bacteroidota bacterium]
MASGGDITQLLQDVTAGDRGAFDHLLSAVYPDLKRIAQVRVNDQYSGQTLSSTALVHEAYLKLVRYQEVDWRGRAHFFGAAASTMRRILIDRARAKSTDKRSGEMVTLLGSDESVDDLTRATLSDEQLLDLDDALARLEAHRPRWVKLIECRYFAGLTIVETAEVLGVSHATVSNDWQLARAWLHRELSG